jgi:hypothetical protein
MRYGALPVLNFVPTPIINNSAPTDTLADTLKRKLNQRLDEDATKLIETKHEDLVGFPKDLEVEVEDLAPDEYSNGAGVAFRVQFQNPRSETPETDGFWLAWTLKIFLNLNWRIGQLTDEGTPISERFSKENLGILINRRHSSVGERIQNDIDNNDEAQRILSVSFHRSDVINYEFLPWMWFSYELADAGPTEDQAWFVAKYLYAHFMIAFLKIKEKLQEALRAQDPDVYDQPNVYNLDENGDRYRRNDSYRMFVDFAAAVQDEKRKQLQKQFPDKNESEIEQMIPRFDV